MFSIPIRLILISVLLGGIGYSSYTFIQRVEQRGYERRVAEEQSDLVTYMKAREKLWEQSLKDTQTREQAVQAELKRQTVTATRRAKTLATHLEEQRAAYTAAQNQLETCNAPTPSLNGFPLLGASVLDDRTVGLLDAARANRDPGDANSATAGQPDAEGQPAATLAPVTGAEFAANDLEVVRLYHELATRHNGLVDWVTQQCVPNAEQPTPKANP